MKEVNRPSELNTHMQLESDKSHTVISLHGQAPIQVNPQSVSYNGNIFAVKDYIATRNELIDKKTATILFNELAGTIELIVNEDKDINTRIKGEAKPNPQLQAFKINKVDGTFALRDLERFVRLNKFFFARVDEHATLLGQLKNFSARISSSMQDDKDARGNKNTSFKKDVQAELLQQFALTIPLYMGQSPTTFEVEVCFDVVDQSSRFWFESASLAELEYASIICVFNEQKAAFTEMGYTIITA